MSKRQIEIAKSLNLTGAFPEDFNLAIARIEQLEAQLANARNEALREAIALCKLNENAMMEKDMDSIGRRHGAKACRLDIEELLAKAKS